MRRVLIAALVLASALSLTAAAHADKNARKVDLFWAAPDLADYNVRSIAMLPVITFDGNLEARRNSEVVLGQQFKGTGYRWVSAPLAKELLTREGGDSLVQAYTEKLRKTPRLDSLDAPRFARATRTRALLSVRIEQFEKRELEFNQSGHAATTVQMRAALVDSTGRLLWTASGSETMEGPYQDAATGSAGVKASGLNTTPVTVGGAPSYTEVLVKLLGRWAEQFPRPAAAAADSTRKN
jgi:hypothetical protein